MSLLLAIEADNLVVSHCVGFILPDGGDGLHETNHGLMALRIKLAVVTCLNASELIYPLCLWKS